MKNNEYKLSLKTKIIYSLPAFSLAIVGIPVYVYIPKFYTDVVGIPIATVGAILLAVRLFDAVTDPLMGLLSDKTAVGYGRRRPYIFFGTFFLIAALLLLFLPPENLGAHKTLWFASSIFALFFFWTVVTVPYEALGPELTPVYHERTNLFSFRDGMLIFGTLVAASSPVIIKTLFNTGEGASGQREMFYFISILYAPAILMASLLCVLFIPERKNVAVPKGVSFFEGIRYGVKNRPFVILLISFTISSFGNNLPATLILYYVQYVLKAQGAELYLFVYFVAGIIFLPFWLKVSKTIGKKSAWLISMAVNTGAFIGVFSLGAGDTTAYMILVVLSGTGFGATLALPSSLQADVIDYDELLTGSRREGQYVGLWSVSKKIAAAGGVGISLWVLGYVGYVPDIEQTEAVRDAIRTMYALVPSLCNLIALAIAFMYPINNSIHDKIKKAITTKEINGFYEDPLTHNKG